MYTWLFVVAGRCVFSGWVGFKFSSEIFFFFNLFFVMADPETIAISTLDDKRCVGAWYKLTVYSAGVGSSVPTPPLAVLFTVSTSNVLSSLLSVPFPRNRLFPKNGSPLI